MFSEHFYFKMIYIIDHNSENEYSISLIILMTTRTYGNTEFVNFENQYA